VNVKNEKKKLSLSLYYYKPEIKKSGIFKKKSCENRKDILNNFEMREKKIAK
jgi:hypothetical protein